MRAGEISIKGSHNLENAMAAVAAGYMLGLEPEDIRKTLMTFPGVSHRLEFVAEIKGVKYINDSKGTNSDASIKAIEAFQEPLVLIAGGRNKGSDFIDLAEKIKARVSKLILVGESKDEIKSAVLKTGFTDIYEAVDFRDAVNKAYSLATQRYCFTFTGLRQF